MICTHCALAADNPVINAGPGKYRVRPHKNCTGCDCQHKPVGTGIKKDIKNAQRTSK